MESSAPPRFVPLDAKKEAKIDELLQLIHTKYPTPPPQLQVAMDDTKDKDAPTARNPTRLYAYAFLNSRKWEVKKAMEMAEAVIEFRQKSAADTRGMFPAPFSIRGWSEDELQAHFGLAPREKGKLDKLAEGVDRFAQGGVHYWDKHGIPVVYMMVGRVDEPGILKAIKKVADVGQSPAEALWPYIEQFNILLEYLSRFQQFRRESGTLTEAEGFTHDDGVIRGMTIVMDCKGLNYKMLWKPVIEMMLQAMKQFFTVFPDSVYQIYAVNAPSVTRVAYSIVKPVLDQNIQAKIHIYGPKETPAALAKVIDIKYIPTYLGGTCCCEGNCIKMLDPAHDDKHKNKKDGTEDDDDEDDEEGTEDIKVSAGSKAQREVTVAAKEVVSWHFAGDEVGFEVFFVPSEALASKEGKKGMSLSKTRDKDMLVHEGKYKSCSDTFTAPTAGKVILIFDNSKAWMNASRIQVQITKVNMEGSTGGEGCKVTSGSRSSSPVAE